MNFGDPTFGHGHLHFEMGESKEKRGHPWRPLLIRGLSLKGKEPPVAAAFGA